MINRKSEKHPEEKTHYSKKDMDDSIFLLRNMQVRRQWNGISKVLKEVKSYQYKIFYPVKTLFKHEGKIKTFSDKLKLIKCISSRQEKLEKKFSSKEYEIEI